jgi:hypothetical protein
MPKATLQYIVVMIVVSVVSSGSLNAADSGGAANTAAQGDSLAVEPRDSLSVAAGDSLPTRSAPDTAAPAPADRPPAIAWNDSLVLIAQPISRYGSPELEDPWLLRLCDAFLHLRLEGIPALSVVEAERLAAAVPATKDYQKGVSKPAYVEAARELGARYVVLLQARHSPLFRDGELALGRETFIFGEFYDAAGDTSLVLQTDELRLKHLGSTLDSFIAAIVEAMDLPEEGRNTLFLTSPILGPHGRKIRKLGKILGEPGGFSNEDLAWRTEAELNKLLAKVETMPLAYYVAAEMFAEGGRHQAAARCHYAVANRLKSLFPPAYIKVARNYRLAGECGKALEVLDKADEYERISEQVIAERRRCR